MFLHRVKVCILQQITQVAAWPLTPGEGKFLQSLHTCISWQEWPCLPIFHIKQHPVVFFHTITVMLSVLHKKMSKFGYIYTHFWLRSMVFCGWVYYTVHCTRPSTILNILLQCTALCYFLLPKNVTSTECQQW